MSRNVKEDLDNLVMILENTKRDLQECRQRNVLLEDLYSKTQMINEELQKEVETLGRLVEVLERKSAASRRSLGIQVYDYELVAELPCESMKQKIIAEDMHHDDLREIWSEGNQALSSNLGPHEMLDEGSEDGELKEGVESVAESVRMAAEDAMDTAGYVYDHSSGLYYHTLSGYYYDAENQLFYDNTQGIYYSYDADSQKYKEHSRVDVTALYACRELSDTNKIVSIDPDKQSVKATKRMARDRKKLALENGNAKSTYSASATRYSKDLRSRRVTENDLRAANMKAGSDTAQIPPAIDENLQTLTYSTNADMALTCSHSNEPSNPLFPDTSEQNNSSFIGPIIPFDALRKSRADEQYSRDNSKFEQNVTQEKVPKLLPRKDELNWNNTENEPSEETTQVSAVLVTEDENLEPDLSCPTPTNTTGIVSEAAMPEGASKDSCWEEGELSDSHSEGASHTEITSAAPPISHVSSEDALSSDDGNGYEPDADKYPPCIRMMVRESEQLSAGSLYIVTCTGATIGREPTLQHHILLTDLQVSKMHCSIEYSEPLRAYLLRDHASMHGTFLNGQRLSKTKKMSDWYRVEHGDEMRLGSTVLLCHIHEGGGTCRTCEPGLVQPATASNTEQTQFSKNEKEIIRRHEMKQLKKKYGLESSDVCQQSRAKGYTDKAAMRRRQVGSDNPYEKQRPGASVHMPISDDNVGHRLLRGMGWKEGEGLGKVKNAITVPIEATVRSEPSAGLGCTTSHSLEQVDQARRSRHWAKARQRFHSLATALPPHSHTAAVSKQASTQPIAFLQGATLDKS